MGVGCGREVGVRLMFWVLGARGLLPHCLRCGLSSKMHTVEYSLYATLSMVKLRSTLAGGTFSIAAVEAGESLQTWEKLLPKPKGCFCTHIFLVIWP